MLTDAAVRQPAASFPEELGSVLDTHLAALADDLNDRHHNKGGLS